MTPTPSLPAPADRASFRVELVRQIAIVLCTIAAIAGSLIGSGALGGTPIAEAAGGALSASATPIAPAVPAFSIWSVVYAGLIAYAIWQLLPAHRSDPRQRRLAAPIAASLLLNAAWILSVQADLLAVSGIVIVVLLVVLAIAFRICLVTRPTTRVEAIVVDGTIGLYLGWVCVATAANITSTLAASGFTGWGLSPDAWAVTILAIAALVGIGLAIGGRGRIAPALSLCWGLAWVAVARLTGEPHSAAAGIAAIVGVIAVLAATAAWRLRHRRSRLA